MILLTALTPVMREVMGELFNSVLTRTFREPKFAFALRTYFNMIG